MARSNRNLLNEVVGGLRLTVYVLSAFTWAVAVMVGIMKVRDPNGSFERAVGLVLIAVAGFIAQLYAEKWVKLLPGLFAVGALSALGPLISGHARLDPSRTVSRLEYSAFLLVFLICAVMADAVAKRNLQVIDRTLLAASFLCFFATMADQRDVPWMLMGTAVGLLALAWILGAKVKASRTPRERH